MCRSRARAAEAGGPSMMLPVGFEQPSLDAGKHNNISKNNEFSFQLMMSQVRAGQVLSLQSSLSCASLKRW